MYTAYTPYQSEASQGFLQAMFEYQSMIADITGMDIANCSLYDGVTAIGEAALMCTRINKRKTFVIPSNISWEKKSVLQNYIKGAEMDVKEVAYDSASGSFDVERLEDILDDSVSGVYLENPNYFGVFEDDVDVICSLAHDKGCLFVVGVDPLSLGVIRDPGDYGADIVVGEGRSFGNPMDFGGSSLGIFACRNKLLRQMPGRLIGMTKDSQGQRAFCMALQTREQHIRRGRATSNICTNEGLCTLAAVVYLSWLGGDGFEELGRLNIDRGSLLGERLSSLPGFDLPFSSSHFNEFVLSCPENPEKLNRKLLSRNIHGGLPLEKWFPELKNCMLVGVSEIYTDAEINRFYTGLKEVCHV
jgi:glycine dehydrogenase subunit 1